MGNSQETSFLTKTNSENTCLTALRVGKCPCFQLRNSNVLVEGKKQLILSSFTAFAITKICKCSSCKEWFHVEFCVTVPEDCLHTKNHGIVLIVDLMI